jgi:hypothetical protein
MVSAFGFNVLTDPMAAVVLLINWAVLPLLIYRILLSKLTRKSTSLSRQ